jgi:hypothetical protein
MMNAETFETRTRARLEKIISESREAIATIETWEALHPDDQPIDRGPFLLWLAGAERALESLNTGLMRQCLDAGEPIPENALGLLRTL